MTSANEPRSGPPSVPSLAETGIEGLDDILVGGLPRDHLYLVQGHPGVGKTTLALQFLLEGVRHGEKGLYITLSESEAELRGVGASHGWSLETIRIFEFKPAAPAEDEEQEYTVFHASEVELNEAMRALLAEVERVQPARVVFDSLSDIRMMAQQPLRYRRQILSLKQHFAGTRRTVLLLDDLTTGAGDSQLESLAHGVIALEQVAPAYGVDRRRLRVSKLRGVRFRTGYHDFVVETGGLRVFPRLVAAEHRRSPPPGLALSGVESLDALLGGGLDRGTSTLILGPAGSGKSVLATQYAVAAAARGERAVLYVFDESAPMLFARAGTLGAELKRQVERGLVEVRQIDPVEMTTGEFAHEVRCAVERDDAKLVVIDSLNGYLHAMPEAQFQLLHLHELLSYLGQQGVVTLVITAQHGLLGTSMESPVDVSYLADSVVMLRYFEASGRVRNAISVLKRRAGAHERTIREFAVGPSGVQIGAPLSDFQGVLTGVPVYTGGSEPLIGQDDGSDRR